MFVLFLLIVVLTVETMRPEVFNNHVAHWLVGIGFSPDSVGLNKEEA